MTIFQAMADAATIAFETARKQENRTLNWQDLMRFAAVPLLADLEAHHNKKLRLPGDSWSVQDYRDEIGIGAGK